MAENASAVRKALRLLSLFGEERPRLGLTEIAVLSSLPKSTTQRFLSYLASENFVSQDPVSKKWGLGVRLLELASLFRADLSLAETAHPHMVRLCHSVGETVSLVLEENDAGICVDRVDSEHELHLKTRVGSPEPLYAGASRKVILANLPPERVEHILATPHLKPITPHTPTDTSSLRLELQAIRERGYAVSDGERNQGVIGVAAPIVFGSATTRTVASIGVAGPAFRFSRERADEVAALVVKATQTVSRTLGAVAEEI